MLIYSETSQANAGVASIIGAKCWLNKSLQIPKPKQGAFMAKLECNYFPDNPASWLCDSCHAQYSERCIPAGHSPLWGRRGPGCIRRSEEHTSELQSRPHLVCRLLLEKKNKYFRYNYNERGKN